MQSVLFVKLAPNFNVGKKQGKFDLIFHEAILSSLCIVILMRRLCSKIICLCIKDFAVPLISDILYLITFSKIHQSSALSLILTFSNIMEWKACGILGVRGQKNCA